MLFTLEKPSGFSRSGLGPAAVLERLRAAVLEMPRAGGFCWWFLESLCHAYRFIIEVYST